MCYLCNQAEQVQDGVTETWDPKLEPITVAELADAVRQAALCNPDKIYERPGTTGCKYTHEIDDKMVPGCIVGQGVFDLTGKVVDQGRFGVAVDGSAWKLALGATSGEKDLYGEAITLQDPLTKYLVTWLRSVQSQQDDGETWGDAVAYADKFTRFADYAKS